MLIDDLWPLAVGVNDQTLIEVGRYEAECPNNRHSQVITQSSLVLMQEAF